MPTYSLNLLFDPADLQTIYAAGEQVVVARAFSDSDSNVAWVVFAPLVSNQVSWQDSYGLYASRSSGSITMSATTDVGIPSGTYYNLTPQGTFDGPFKGAEAPPAGSYRAFNQMTSYPYFNSGLIQAATVNGTAVAAGPTTTVVVPASQFGTFTPQSTVYVWLQSHIAAGAAVQVPPPAMTAVGSVSSPSTMIQFPSGTTSLTYRYDAKTASFLPAGG